MFTAKEKTAAEVGDTAMAYVKEANTEAAKYLLLKGAIWYFAQAKEDAKAVAAIAALGTQVKERPLEEAALPPLRSPLREAALPPLRPLRTPSCRRRRSSSAFLLSWSFALPNTLKCGSLDLLARCDLLDPPSRNVLLHDLGET